MSIPGMHLRSLWGSPMNQNKHSWKTGDISFCFLLDPDHYCLRSAIYALSPCFFCRLWATWNSCCYFTVFYSSIKQAEDAFWAIFLTPIYAHATPALPVGGKKRHIIIVMHWVLLLSFTLRRWALCHRETKWSKVKREFGTTEGTDATLQETHISNSNFGLSCLAD